VTQSFECAANLFALKEYEAWTLIIGLRRSVDGTTAVDAKEMHPLGAKFVGALWVRRSARLTETALTGMKRSMCCNEMKSDVRRSRVKWFDLV